MMIRVQRGECDDDLQVLDSYDKERPLMEKRAVDLEESKIAANRKRRMGA